MNESELNEFKKNYIEKKNIILETQKTVTLMNGVLRENGLFYNPWKDKFEALVDGEAIFKP